MPRSSTDFEPGDVLTKRGRIAYAVADPARTQGGYGKLRLHSVRGDTVSRNVVTTWWQHPDTGYTLPSGYALLPDIKLYPIR